MGSLSCYAAVSRSGKKKKREIWGKSEVEWGGGKMTEGCGERWRGRRKKVGEKERLIHAKICWEWNGFMITATCCHSNRSSTFPTLPSPGWPGSRHTYAEAWALQKDLSFSKLEKHSEEKAYGSSSPHRLWPPAGLLERLVLPKGNDQPNRRWRHNRVRLFLCTLPHSVTQPG